MRPAETLSHPDRFASLTYVMDLFFDWVSSDCLNQKGRDVKATASIYSLDVRPVLYIQLMTEIVFDVLCVADMYLLTGLKRLCGKTLAMTICEENVLYMWKMAKLFRLSRLEDLCTEYMAKIIERVGVGLCIDIRKGFV